MTRLTGKVDENRLNQLYNAFLLQVGSYLKRIEILMSRMQDYWKKGLFPWISANFNGQSRKKKRKILYISVIAINIACV